MKQQLMSGNEAIARGAYEAGVAFASGYPGTPSTEILGHLGQYGEVYAEWAPNEKVAFEAAMGASLAGARALVTLKQVGLNVAADPLMNWAYTGVNAGFVVVSADEPSMHSSQTEQDSKYYARFAKIPCLEPSDSQEAKEFVGFALDISEQFDTPVMLRETTRIAHTSCVIETVERKQAPVRRYEKNATKYSLLPANARRRRVAVEERLEGLREYAETFPGNRIEWGGRDVGIVTTGISYQYAREVFGDRASYLKLGMPYPIPEKMLKAFADGVKTLYVIEEADPFLEEQVRLAGFLDVQGIARRPYTGELDPDIVAACFDGEKLPDPVVPTVDLPARPPTFCPGCPERTVFCALKELGVVVTGDIGCYGLAAAPPLDAVDTIVCMGAGVTMGFGFSKAAKRLGEPKKTVAVLGDSTFFHTGIPGIVESVYNGGDFVMLVLDNSTTAMTGHQPNPGTGWTLKGEKTTRISIEEVCRACGVKNVKKVDAYDLESVKNTVKELLDSAGTSVVIAERPCVLLKGVNTANGKCRISADLCINCGTCLSTGCPALVPGKEHPTVDESQCNGCTLCMQSCPVGAIEKVVINR